MRRTLGIGGLAIGVMVVLAIGAHEPTGAQFSGLGAGFGAVQEPKTAPAPAARVHVRLPFSEEEVAILRALERPIRMPFATDTPLSDALEYIRRQTAEGEGAIEGGIPFYVDQRGLQEAEQSLQSPIALDLDGIPLKTTLRLLLDQLDLVYEVQPEGFVIITAREAREAPADPMLLILDELRALRAEVEELKRSPGPGGM